MSWLVLRSVAQTRLTQPNLTVRYHANLDKAFFDECVEVMKLGFGMPALNNDEIIIPSFLAWGVSEYDAYNYSAIGCVETAVPGRWGYRCTGMSYINFPRLLLCAMNGGVDLTSGKRFVEGHGNFLEWESFDELMAAWDASLREMCRWSVVVENAIDKASERDVPDVLCSALTDDCIARGKTIKEGGAVYDFISGLQVGIANMADSLAAIKKLVYEEGAITRQQLWDALQSDFEGEEGARIQQMLIDDAPKYGNDDDYVDSLAVECYEPYIDEVAKYHNTRFGRGPIGGIRYAGTSSISANVGQGMGTMATPDGRQAHEPLAEGCSPAHNCDKQGPTAVFKTVSKLPTDKITGGVLLNQKVTPTMLAREQNKVKLQMMLRTFFNRLHGYHVQFNVVDRARCSTRRRTPSATRTSSCAWPATARSSTCSPRPRRTTSSTARNRCCRGAAWAFPSAQSSARRARARRREDRRRPSLAVRCGTCRETQKLLRRCAAPLRKESPWSSSSTALTSRPSASCAAFCPSTA